MDIKEILIKSLSSTPIHFKEVFDKHPEITLEDLQTATCDLIARQIILLDANWKLSIPQQVERVVH